MKPMMTQFDPRFGLVPFGDVASDYLQSPVASVVGLAADAAIAYFAYYLWTHEHKGWGAVLGLLALGGAGYNIYNLSRPR